MLAPVADFERSSASSSEARLEAATELASSELAALLNSLLLLLSSLRRYVNHFPSVAQPQADKNRPVD